jgi:hypothetical protein
MQREIPVTAHSRPQPTHTMLPVALPIPYKLRQMDFFVCPAMLPAMKDKMRGLAPNNADKR